MILLHSLILMDTCTIITCLQKFRLIDTAGIRRRAVVSSSGSLTEALSVNRAFRAIRRSDVVALVIEAMACITEQVVHPSLFLGP
jgi:predicted GTPase